jgi:hypothetical protein
MNVRPLAALLGLLAFAAHADLRDPMRPPLAAAGPAAPHVEPLPTLSAVMGGEGRRVAILAGRVVRPGDVVAGGVVAAVAPDGVSFRRGGTVHELKLAPAVRVRQTATVAARDTMIKTAAGTPGAREQ